MKKEDFRLSANSATYEKSSPQTIRALFASIAKDYDQANDFASLGRHRVWNQKLIDSISPAQHLLDLCAGTGEIALGFLKTHPQSCATLVDFCPEMLHVAQHKGQKFAQRMRTICADAMELPFPKQTFDAVTLAYGIRNVAQPQTCLQEVFRVLQPQGTFSILELTRPSFAPLGWMHKLYTYTCLPLFGRYISNNASAYRYLAKSVQKICGSSRVM